MSSLIPPEHRPKMMNVLPRHSFEVLYRLNCDSLCSDFQEDLEFRFSLGLVNIIKCFLGPSRSKKVLGKSAESVRFVFFYNKHYHFYFVNYFSLLEKTICICILIITN